MDLDERKIKILEAIINDYIKTAEPVGSRTIVKKYDMGISSATIRNEMADLEELGLLMQPHTSAGRIPSDKGYRLYVDEMLKNSKVPATARKQIDELFDKTYKSLDIFLKEISDLVSELTSYTVVASKPQSSNSTIKNIQLILIDPHTILLVTVINKNMIKNNTLQITEPVTQEVLNAISEILNENLCNLTLEEINLNLLGQAKQKLGKYKNILDPVVDIITEMLNELDSPDYYASGLTNILNYPEFTDVTIAKEILGLIEDKQKLSNLLTSNDTQSSANDYEIDEIVSDDGKSSDYPNKISKEKSKKDTNNQVSIRIGNENHLPFANDCSVISCKYELDDELTGVISIIGPKRMDYENSISILNAIINSMKLKKEDMNKHE